jgi:hypothetical protein
LVLIGRIHTFVASAVFAFVMATAANAATVTYTNADATPVMELTIGTEDGSGVFTFSFKTTVGTADYLALGFDIAGEDANLITQLKIGDATGTNFTNGIITPELVLYGDNSGSQSSCEQGCNFNGSGSETLFDYIIKIGLQGGNGDNYVKTVEFTILGLEELTLDDFSQFSIRAQSTSNPEGSIKTDLTLTPVPLPAGLPLLLSGLLAVGLLARRRIV